MIKQSTTNRIKSIKDVHAVANSYLPNGCAVKRITNAVDALNRIGYKLIVGWKNNLCFTESINPDTIFNNDQGINNYLTKKYGTKWTSKISKEDIDKCIATAVKKGHPVEKVKVNINNTKNKVPDIRVVWITPGMRVEDFVKKYLVGIKKSLIMKEKVIDSEITTLAKPVNEKTDEELAMELETDGKMDVPVDDLTEEEVNDEMLEESKPANDEDGPSTSEEILQAMNELIEGQNTIVKTLETYETRLSDLEDPPKKKKTGEKKKSSK